MKKLLCVLSLFTAIICSSEAAVVGWAAGRDNGFSLPDGAPLPVGNEVRIGHFSVDDAEINLLVRTGNLVALEQFFTMFGTAIIGEGTDIIALPPNQRAGHFQKSSSGNPDAAELNGNQIYIWAFATGDNSAVTAAYTNVTASGVFYLADSPRWIFPAENDVPNTTDVDLTDLTDGTGNNLVANARIPAGTFPNGLSPASGVANFGLIAIPEPGTAGLLMAGVLGLVIRRRREAPAA